MEHESRQGRIIMKGWKAFYPNNKNRPNIKLSADTRFVLHHDWHYTQEEATVYKVTDLKIIYGTSTNRRRLKSK